MNNTIIFNIFKSFYLGRTIIILKHRIIFVNLYQRMAAILIFIFPF